MIRQLLAIATWAMCLALALAPAGARAADAPLRKDVEAALRRAAGFYRGRVAVHGGYVYYTSLDLKQRWGEGKAGPEEIWVQPPGTPTVGLAYLKAYEATGDRFYLDAAQEAAEALVHGQLQSGGWTNSIDFDPRGPRVALYRNGKGQGRGKNHSTLDDGISQGAIRLLLHVDQALGFKHPAIHDSTRVALDALIAAQFPSGGFPQVWTGPVGRPPVVRASYPDYDWRTEHKLPDYWNHYTLNDGLAGTVVATLKDAHAITKEPRCLAALARLGDFLILAQMPDPQPAWAQQYGDDMRPIWARKFEPPAIAGRESQDAIAALMEIHRLTGDPKYLEPIPRALAYLRKSLLSDGRLARYYELKTNRPLYMNRKGTAYFLTYDDSDLPSHYGWKGASQLDELESQYHALKRGPKPNATPPPSADLEARVVSVLRDLDDQGRWISTYQGGMMVGQPKFPKGFRYLSSEVFSRNVEVLSEYLRATR
jgi:PelA/Pel-15E family pectate lyase